MSNISKIRISGNTYQLKDEEATNVVELTQAEYDQLPSSAKTSNTLFIITDAQGADLSNYYTKSETSGATEISTALASKADAATTYSKTEVDTALASKQTTLTAGTNITIVDNVISATGGGGGGKAISGGTNISITTGETADTINCTLPIVDWGNNNITFTNKGYGSGSHTLSFGDGAVTQSNYSMSLGNFTKARGNYSVAIGYGGKTNASFSNAFGYYTVTNNERETAQGVYNNSVSGSSTFGDSGNTLFSIGNGTADNARHNAFEIRQNGDIYITSGGTDIKLQDNLGGGGGSSYTAGDGIDITNDVISVTGKVDTSAITTTITSSSTDAQVPSAKAVYDQIGNINTILESI